LRGELEWRHERAGDDRGSPFRYAPRDHGCPLLDARRCRKLARRPLRPAATARRRPLADRQARAAERVVDCDLPREGAPAGPLDDPRRVERQPGGAGLPRRPEPAQGLPARLIQRTAPITAAPATTSAPAT